MLWRLKVEQTKHDTFLVDLKHASVARAKTKGTPQLVLTSIQKLASDKPQGSKAARKTNQDNGKSSSKKSSANRHCSTHVFS
jgi:hypothetical protein